MTILHALDEIASIKEAEAKAYRNLVKVVAGVAEKTKGIPAIEAIVEDDTPKEAPKKAATVKEEKKEEVAAVTVEQVRAVLAEKSQAGLTSNVKELLESFGAYKLSAVKPEDYESLLVAAKELK